jgi:hypothetical protein
MLKNRDKLSPSSNTMGQAGTTTLPRTPSGNSPTTERITQAVEGPG